MKKAYLFIMLIIIFASLMYFSFKNNNLDISLGDKGAGDINNDGKINSLDYILLRKYLLKTSTLSISQQKNGDLNDDGKITSIDYILLKRIILSKQIPMPTGTPKKKESKNVIDVGDAYIVYQYNVVDYGADPSGNKDSTESFRIAINKANSCTNQYYDNPSNPCSTGNVVYVPEGRYKISGSLTLNFHTALIGSNMDKTILMIYHGRNTTDVNQSAVIVNTQAMVKNITFWYPEQTLSGGNAIAYPPTIAQANGEGLTLENIKFINSYTAMDFATLGAAHPLQFVRNVYGTPLNVGLINDSNLDTSRIQNINFNPSYWLNSGLGTPNSSTLSNYLSSHATGIISERVDWGWYADINISEYNIGMRFKLGTTSANTGQTIGAYYNVNLNCVYPVYVDAAGYLAFTKGVITTHQGGTAFAISKNVGTSISHSSVNGSTSISIGERVGITVTESKVNGPIGVSKSSKISLVNDALSNTGSYDSYSSFNTSVSLKENENIRKTPTSKPGVRFAVVISAKEREDITSKIKNAIVEAKNNGGGIVYIPLGDYIVKDSFTVPSGVEIQGAVTWGHNINAPSKLIAQYSGSSPLFILEANSGINGLTITYPDTRGANYPDKADKDYSKNAAPTIQGRGSNIYVKNVNIENAWTAIDMASYKCDNHYIERIWAYAHRYGIKVGSGSSNGIIKDCHFQIATYRQYSGYESQLNDMMANISAYEIGNSSNEVLLNNFAFKPNYGFHITNAAKNVYIVNGGVDVGQKSLYIDGNATAQVVNAFIIGDPLIAGNVAFASGDSFSGKLDIINSLSWGSTKGTSYNFKGSGTVTVTAGQLYDSTAPMIKSSVKNLSISGTLLCWNPYDSCFSGYRAGQYEIEIASGSSAASVASGLCLDGNCNIGNSAGINVSIVGAGGAAQEPGADVWSSKSLSNTIVNARGATTTICGLGKAKEFKYSSVNDGEKKALVSSGCATISISPAASQILKYTIVNSDGSTVSNTVGHIGKYLILAQMYNYMLHLNPALNNESNIGAWVNTCSQLSSCITQIGTIAINNFPNENNGDFVNNLYKSTLGRSPDQGGYDSWVGQLNSGAIRAQTLQGFVASEEAVKIYAAWGYN